MLGSKPRRDRREVARGEQGNPIADRHDPVTSQREMFRSQDVEVEGMEDRVPPPGGGDEPEEVSHRRGTDGCTPIPPHIWIVRCHRLDRCVIPHPDPDERSARDGDAGCSARFWRDVRGDGRTFV